MTKEDTPYQPIECGLHSEYELAIMHKERVILSWIGINNKTQTETVEPIDIMVRDKQEFLKVRTENNKTNEIRLDKIVQFLSVKN
ncbi:MAG: transcriptional antiterminator, Rof [Gammaproteobacteria bacterium]|nr:transcriptional antiterminator, Rof [Gammaproteobacteria bacterium]